MSWDYEMSEGENFCTPITTNLNEDLSQVEYIFSDKTGK
jgi:magnesium-transporting ATPase (P-type)